MGILDSLGSLFYSDDSGNSTGPTYQPYKAPVPQYQATPQGQQQTNQLGDVLKGRLAAYQHGGSTLDPAYRAAVLGDAQASANTTAQDARNQLGEQMNKWGLLNSSATGYGLGKIGQQQELTLQHAQDYLTEQDLQGVNNLMASSQGYQNQQGQVAQNQLGAQQFGYAAGQKENENMYTGQLNQYNAQQQQRSNLLNGLFGLGKAGLMALGKR